ncbi:MAG: DinB family protein [Acidobacteriota bacterium]
MGDLPNELQVLVDALNAIDRDARALVEGLSPEEGAWRPAPGAWSVAECLDHLATANRVYLAAMDPPAARALAAGRARRGPARPGVIGRWFVRSLEPPPRRIYRSKAPRLIRPRQAPPLADAVDAFFASQEAVRRFIRSYATLDLSRIRFPNPFVPGVRFRLATGLHVIAAHDRRHLWQARRVREALSGRA